MGSLTDHRDPHLTAHTQPSAGERMTNVTSKRHTLPRAKLRFGRSEPGRIQELFLGMGVMG